MIDDSKYVLGISALFHDSAAVLVRGNQILAAAQEERFTRKKGDASFPHRAIQYCLCFLPSGKALDAVVFYENPVLKLDRFLKNALENYPKGGPIWFQTLKTTNWLI